MSTCWVYLHSLTLISVKYVVISVLVFPFIQDGICVIGTFFYSFHLQLTFKMLSVMQTVVVDSRDIMFTI